MITKLFEFEGDGWWPRVSRDARKVCFGNGLSRVFDVETGKIWSAFPARQSRWITDDIVTCTVEIDTLHAKRFERSESSISDKEDNPSLVAGNDFDADSGHWLSCIAAGRLVIDGRVIEGHFRNAQMKWPWVVATRDDREIVWFLNGILEASAPLPARANELRLQADGSVTTGYFWDVQELEPHEPVIDVTITPWHREKPHVMCPEVAWAWTTTETPDGRLGVIGVAGLDGNAVIIDGWGCAWLDVQFNPNTNAFIVAGCDTNGKLRVYRVDRDTEKQNLARWGTSTYSRTPSELPAFASPKYFGAWFTEGRYGSFNIPCNAGVLGGQLLFEDGNGHIPENAYDIIRNRASIYPRLFVQADKRSIEAVKEHWDRVVAVIHHEVGNGAETLQATRNATALVKSLGLAPRLVMSCLRPEDTTDPTYANTADIAGCEIYFDKPASSLAEMEHQVNLRLDAVLATHPGLIMLYPQQYDRSLDPDWQKQPAMMEVIMFQCMKRMAEVPRIIGSLSFACGRPGGLITYDRLLWWHNEVAKLISTPPLKKKEEKMFFPNDEQNVNALQRIALSYVNDLKRPEGIFGVPPDGLGVAITRPDGAARIDTKSLAVWLGRYFIKFNEFGGDHERAIRWVEDALRNSDEAKSHRPL